MHSSHNPYFMAFFCHQNQTAALFALVMTLKCEEPMHFSNYTVQFLNLVSTTILKPPVLFQCLKLHQRNMFAAAFSSS